MTRRDDRWLDEATDPHVRAVLSALTAPATEAELARETEIVTAMARAVLACEAGDVEAEDLEPTSGAGPAVWPRAGRRVAVVAGVVAVSFATAAAASEIVTSLSPGDRWPERPPTVTQPEAPPTDDGPSTGAGGEEGPTPESPDDPPSTVPPGPAPTTTTTTAPSTSHEGRSTGPPTDTSSPHGPPSSPPGPPADPGGGSGGPPSSPPAPPADPGPPDTRPGAAGRGADPNGRAPDPTSPPATGTP